jgi:putative ATP-binding cassette transporter
LHLTGFSIFNSHTEGVAQFFIIGCVFISIANYLSSLLSMHINQKVSLVHRLFLFRRIQEMSYHEMEKIGQFKWINLLGGDVSAVTVAALSYPSIWVSSVTIVGILGYLIYIDQRVFTYVLSVTILSILLYQIPLHFGTKHLKKARELSDDIQEGVRGLIFGAKELKLNRKRSDDFLEFILHKAEFSRRKSTYKGNAFIDFGDTFIQLTSNMVMAMVFFYLPYVFVLTQNELIGIVVILIYLTGPIGSIMGDVRSIKEGKISLLKLQEFYANSKSSDIEKLEPIANVWSEYRVQGVGYKYSKYDSVFAL